jgi:hypothetical protein
MLGSIAVVPDVVHWAQGVERSGLLERNNAYRVAPDWAIHETRLGWLASWKPQGPEISSTTP